MNPTILNAWLAEWAQTWSLPMLPERAQIETSARMKTALGRCYPVSGVIRLHPGLENEPEAILREVVCHEVAHLAVYLRHGREARPHGIEWKRFMIAAGYEPRTRMDPSRLSKNMQRAIRRRVRPRTILNRWMARIAPRRRLSGT